MTSPPRAATPSVSDADAAAGDAIWDLHAHLSGVPGDTPEERLARLLEFADRMGVERLCLSMGMDWSYDPTPDDLRRQNDDVLRAVASAPRRAFGFVYLSPAHVGASLEEIERCVARGPMVGAKLWVARRCDDPGVDPLVARAAELRAPVLQHAWYKVGGNLPGESDAADVAALAARHPTATIVCGHSGGDWELGLAAIRDAPNVLADLGGGDPTAGFVEAAVRDLGADRVLFGSDVGGRGFASQLAKVLGADLDADARRRILGGNLRRVLAPILRSKRA